MHSEEIREQVLAQVTQTISRAGWAAMAVFPRSEADGHHFTYTIGLAEKGLPELYVPHLDAQRSMPLLHALVPILEDGVELGETLEVPDWPPVRLYRLFLEHPELQIGALLEYREKVLRTSEQPRLLQVVFPDPSGKFPGEEGYDFKQCDWYQWRPEQELTWDWYEIAEDLARDEEKAEAYELPVKSPQLLDAILRDPDEQTWAWDGLTDCLTEWMEDVNPGGQWHVEGENLGWMRRSGYKDFDARTGSAFLQAILPETECTFSIKRHWDHLVLRNAHHDAHAEVYWAYRRKEEEDG